jgi:hypothetical protein
VDGIGGLFRTLAELFRTLAESFVGLFSGVVRAFGDAVQGVFGVFQSLLPGLWLPVVAIVIVLVVGWRLAKS